MLPFGWEFNMWLTFSVTVRSNTPRINVITFDTDGEGLGCFWLFRMLKTPLKFYITCGTTVSSSFVFISVNFFVAQDHDHVIPLWIQLKGSFLSRFYFVLFLFWTWFSSLILFRILSSRAFCSFENMLLVVMVNFKAVSSSTSSTDCLVRYHHLQI